VRNWAHKADASHCLRQPFSPRVARRPGPGRNVLRLVPVSVIHRLTGCQPAAIIWPQTSRWALAHRYRFGHSSRVVAVLESHRAASLSTTVRCLGAGRLRADPGPCCDQQRSKPWSWGDQSHAHLTL